MRSKPRNVKTYPNYTVKTPAHIYLSDAALNDVVGALKAVPSSGKLDVRGVMGIPQNVVKYDTITFADQSVLMLEAVEAPFIALAAKTVVLDIHNPAFRAVLARPVGPVEAAILAQLNGADGAAGADGARGADGGGNGTPGGNAGPGQSGNPGATKQIPPIFFFVQDFIFGANANPDKQYFNLVFDGFAGGNGGSGGRGGNGGNGGNGQNAVSDLFGCKSGAGYGGHGGNGGPGGRGGNAANGGDGAHLFLYAPDASIFNFTTATIEPGPPGVRGLAGAAGAVGVGGNGGAPTNLCLNWGAKGQNGFPPNPPNFGVGSDANAGNRGIQTVTSRDNSDLFP